MKTATDYLWFETKQRRELINITERHVRDHVLGPRARDPAAHDPEREGLEEGDVTGAPSSVNEASRAMYGT